MTHALVDPEMLGLPDDFLAWVEEFDDWGTLLADSPLSASCPTNCLQEIYELWSDHRRVADALAVQACPLDAHDLLRVLDTIIGRFIADPLPVGHEVMLENIVCTPAYCPPAATPGAIATFVEYLGRLAVRRTNVDVEGGVITRDESWSHSSDDIEVEGIVALRELDDGALEEPESHDAAVRELLHVWRDPASVIRVLSKQPCALMSHLEFGVRAYWLGEMGGDERELPITFGADFTESVEYMNYARDSRRAGALLRVMAKIAAGRAQDVPGHLERKGPGANNPVMTDADGYKVERSYLARNSPNAHRLFWVRRPVPHMLNVGGHESRPIL